MIEFWVYNCTKKTIVLEDLQIRIPPMKYFNLLNKTKITPEQIKKSLESGSLFKKKQWIIPQVNPPQIQKYNISISPHSIVTPDAVGIRMVKENLYNELELQIAAQETDEEYFKKFLEEEEEIWNPKGKK